jgi:phage gp46-like protein
MDILFRDTEGTDPQPSLLWDTLWNQSDDLSAATADWQLAGPNAPLNAYGLAANHALDTAILLSLFTWRRAEKYDVLPAGTDPKGWWGDDTDLQDSEGPLGSRLWLLIRAPLNANTIQLAETYAYEALQPLIDQGAVATFVCTATINKVAGFLVLAVNAYSQNGQLIYSQKFENIWRQEFPTL